jgi:hypothetical protein
MNIKLYIKENNFIKLCLISGEKEIDCLEWQDRNDLSRVLLANLDKLFRENRISLDKISGYKIMSEVPRKWTTYRIADITFKTLKIARFTSSADKLAK